MPGSDVHDMSYYAKCMVGGILSCGITHTLVCPLDIVKCRKQVRMRIHIIERIMPKLMTQHIVNHGLRVSAIDILAL